MIPHLQIYFETFWFCILWALRPCCPLAKALSFLNPIQNRLIPLISFLFHFISKRSKNPVSAQCLCSPALECVPVTQGPTAGVPAPCALPSVAALPRCPSLWLTALLDLPTETLVSLNVWRAFSDTLCELPLYKLPCTVILGALYSAITLSYWKSWHF